VVVLWVAGLAAASVASAEDGYDLWMRYRLVEQPWADRYRAALTQLVAGSASPTLRVAHAELERGLQGLLGVSLVPVTDVSQDGALVIGTRRSLPQLAELQMSLPPPGSQGYAIRSTTSAGHRILVIAAEDDVGVL